MKPTLFMLDTHSILVEVLGLLTAVKVSRPCAMQHETHTLLGRVVSPGASDSSLDHAVIPGLKEGMLVAFDRGAGVELELDRAVYRSIDRRELLLALNPVDLANAGIESEDLVVPVPVKWPAGPVFGAASAMPGWVPNGPGDETQYDPGPPPNDEPDLAPEPEEEPEPEVPQITIEYINQRGQGFAVRIEIPEGTTLAGLLELKGITPQGRELRVLTPTLGEVPPMADYVLQPGDHVEAVPVEVGVGFSG